MKAIICVGHGELPIAMKQSVEMIAGNIPNLYSLSLSPEDGKDEFREKIECLDREIQNYDEILIFTDLKGGSPGNGIFEYYLENENVEIISGMNLPMVLTACVGVEETVSLISEGKNGISPLKTNLKNKEINNKNNELFFSQQTSSNNEPYQILNVRVDARGIHGQVATAWVPKLKVDRIIVIDDKAVRSETQKSALKMAKPNNVKLSILNTKKAVERLNDPTSYIGEKILVIIQNISTLDDLSNLDYHFEAINIGNVPNREGTKSFAKTIYLTEEEIEILNNLIGKGTKFTAQMVPTDPIVSFNEIIKGDK